MFKIGIDVGGTFTDFLVTSPSGAARAYKSPSVPQDPAEGVFAGLAKIATDRGESLSDFLRQVEVIVHGTTITTNAALTGKGAKTGLLTTRGFRDLLNMRRGLKELPYVRYDPPAPLVPRYLIEPITERSSVEAEIVTPLAEDEVRSAARRLRELGVEAIAVCYLWSFFNPVNERRTAEIIREEIPGIYLSLSSEILPQIRVYERISTTTLNSYVGPLLSRYLGRLARRLEEEGFGGILLIMQSNGGVMSLEVSARFAVNTLLSGPAGAPTAGRFYSAVHGIDDFITVDMGGTSFDACLVRNREPAVTTEGAIGGYRVALPILDIHTVGAGGGSIAYVDDGGLLHVGPESAGAHPGPACYARGGTHPTVTDADLVLGYLDPDFFFGGEIKLDRAAAEAAIRKHVAAPLKLDLMTAAYGIYR
ncbi:MAG TPA: hydantoinase/oxoprolinase family protein, partial [Candidatus Binataceae bacterium]|nr:hydantoinase/oxoprolinase family protein [Candidatus Binataceae bacterium]